MVIVDAKGKENRKIKNWSKKKSINIVPLTRYDLMFTNLIIYLSAPESTTSLAKNRPQSFKPTTTYHVS